VAGNHHAGLSLDPLRIIRAGDPLSGRRLGRGLATIPRGRRDWWNVLRCCASPIPACCGADQLSLAGGSNLGQPKPGPHRVCPLRTNSGRAHQRSRDRQVTAGVRSPPPPRLVEPRFQRAAEAKDHDPTLIGNRLHQLFSFPTGALGPK
jgi:hypothetical protein